MSNKGWAISWQAFEKCCQAAIQSIRWFIPMHYTALHLNLTLIQFTKLLNCAIKEIYIHDF